MTYISNALAIIGAGFIVLLIAGLLMNGKQCAISLDQFVGTCLRRGHMADETISAWAHRCQHHRLERFINWIFRDPNHCALAYVSEMRGDQNAREYRRG
ncbi:hypothetical protein [Dechloromonas sp. CZR5]|uniref:hypothetical protein n=1 Tax=Dechloromonas sp. CZR5 TaxID=2608630 RepID=UPI00123D3B68|nr:hypothetical protein [Dechloromonas sp. CZR5]